MTTNRSTNAAAAEKEGAQVRDGCVPPSAIAWPKGVAPTTAAATLAKAGNDWLYVDSSIPPTDPGHVSAKFHGDAYLDGEEGDDVLVGGGEDDTLYGADGTDHLWGDDEACPMVGADDIVVRGGRLHDAANDVLRRAA